MDAALNGSYPTGAARAVLAALEGAGLEAWIVGGWVRDALRGAASHDIDICCSGSWQESARALVSAGIDVVESGIKFGGITAIAAGEHIEVTSYRFDGFYTDGRHPESIKRAERVEDDLARRDFTVNAMAWHPKRGLLDLYGGVEDLRARVIRAVGEPRRRFEEDALRMLRAVRFACRLDFAMDPETAGALAFCAPLLDAVARERVGIELEGILATGRAGAALLSYPEIMCAAIPELAACRGFDQRSVYHPYDVYEHVARVLAEAGAHAKTPSASLMWAALLHDIAKPSCFTVDEDGAGHFYGHPEAGAELARSVMRRLSISGELMRDACVLIRYHDEPLRPERGCLLRLLAALSTGGADAPRLADELFDLMRADALAKAPSCRAYAADVEALRQMVHGLVASGEPYTLKMLDLTGRDLLAAGVTPGPRLGELLEGALDAVIDGEARNARDALLSYLGL